MITRLLTIVLMLLAVSSFAANVNDIDTRGLNDAQITELKIQALKLQQSGNSTATPATPATATQGVQQISNTALTEAEKWSSFGKNLGTAMVSTAKELGVAVNDFSKTDIGKITTAIIVFKLVGAKIIHFFTGLILLFLLPYLIISARNHLSTVNVEYEYQERKFFGYFPYQKKVVKSIEGLNSSDAFWVFLWTCVLVLVSIGFSLIIMLGG